MLEYSLGWILGKKFLYQITNINEKFDDYITYLIVGIIIGGRLGYVIFYNLNYYSNNLFDIFKIWQGGMSFHGGVIGDNYCKYYGLQEKILKIHLII